MERLSPEDMIQFLPALKATLEGLAGDENLLEVACRENPWFTPFYIKTAIGQILPWMSEGKVEKLMKREGPFAGDVKRVGIIMAGNLPLVGFQDLFHTLLAGHVAVVKPASKDKVLMAALVERLRKAFPAIESRLELVSALENVDFLLATGGNNTGRQLEHKFRKVPKVLRKHRFSAAKLTGNESEEQLRALCEDVLLYNGMGCRNVSLLLTPENWDANSLIRVLNQWPLERLSQPYLELLEWEKARLEMLGADLLPCKTIVLQKVDQVAVPSVGLLNWLPLPEGAEKQVLAALEGQLQCLAGADSEVRFGETQCPKLDDFADGVNVLLRLRNL